MFKFRGPLDHVDLWRREREMERVNQEWDHARDHANTQQSKANYHHQHHRHRKRKMQCLSWKLLIGSFQPIIFSTSHLDRVQDASMVCYCRCCCSWMLTYELNCVRRIDSIMLIIMFLTLTTMEPESFERFIVFFLSYLFQFFSSMSMFCCQR